MTNMKRLLAGLVLAGAVTWAAAPADAHTADVRSAFACGGTRTWPMNANFQVFHAHTVGIGSGWTYHSCEGTDLIHVCRWKSYYVDGVGPFGPIDAECSEL